MHNILFHISSKSNSTIQLITHAKVQSQLFISLLTAFGKHLLGLL